MNINIFLIFLNLKVFEFATKKLKLSGEKNSLTVWGPPDTEIFHELTGRETWSAGSSLLLASTTHLQ